MKGVEGSKDDVLLERLKQEDASAFAQIIEQFRGPLYYYAFNLLKREEEAKDIVQDTFVELWRLRHKLSSGTCLGSFLFILTKQRSIDLIRHWDVERRRKELCFNESTCVSGEDILDNRILGNHLAAAISSLPSNQQAVFKLIMFENKSHNEIVKALSLKPQTVKNNMSKALANLREKLAFIKK